MNNLEDKNHNLNLTTKNPNPNIESDSKTNINIKYLLEIKEDINKLHNEVETIRNN